MINHGDDYKLLKEMSILEESPRLEREDHLQVIRQEIKKDSRKAYKRNVHLSHFRNNFNKKLASQFSKCRVKQKRGNAYYILESPQGKEIGTYAKDVRS